MKYNLTALLLLLAILVSAGEQKSTPTRFYVGPSVTTGICYRLLTKNNQQLNYSDSLGADLVLKRRNSDEHPSVGLLTGIKAGYRATGFLSIEVGVEYGLMQYQYRAAKYYRIFTPSGIDSVYIKQRFVYRAQQFNIPVGLNFTIGKKKVRGIINTGVALNISLSRQQISYTTIGGDTKRIKQPDGDTFNTLNISPFITAGVELDLAQLKYKSNTINLLLRIAPTAQMQVLKNIDTPLTERLWSAGVNTSLLFEFGKAE